MKNLKINTISDLINQSYKIFNTYGKTEADIHAAIPGFMEVLGHYHVDRIISGFKIWLDEEATLPTPSDIKKIIEKWKPMDKYNPPDGRTSFPTDEEIANVEAMVQNLRKDHDEANRSTKDRTKQDYTHFEKSSPQQQEQLKKGLKNMVNH